MCAVPACRQGMCHLYLTLEEGPTMCTCWWVNDASFRVVHPDMHSHTRARKGSVYSLSQPEAEAEHKELY